MHSYRRAASINKSRNKRILLDIVGCKNTTETGSKVKARPGRWGRNRKMQTDVCVFPHNQAHVHTNIML